MKKMVYAAIISTYDSENMLLPFSTSYSYSNNSPSGGLPSLSPVSALSPLPSKSPSPLLCSSGEADGASGDGTRPPSGDVVPVTFML
jgi:hypothetical protein